MEEGTVWRSPFSIEIEERREHLDSLEGARLKLDFNSLNTSIFILSGNGRDLLGLASKFSKTSVHVRQLPGSFPDEFSRLLHNLLASAKSLMEVQRSVGNRWWGKESDFMAKERSEVLRSIFIADEVEFLYKLRDFALHLGSPLLEIVTEMRSVGAGPVEQENSIRLHRDQLLKWTGWRGGRNFLEKQAEEFEIFEVIERYFKSVTDYHLWFWRRLEDEFSSSIEEHQEKAQELFLWAEEFVGSPEWFRAGADGPPVGWSARRFRAENTQARYSYGSRGFRIFTVSAAGSISVGESSGWENLPRRIDISRGVELSL
ncbi:hypothetical protein [Dietzia sp. PP-33]|uniref:hypothetical protein n=1 Tax=Dietzia sp. PP-33 TaxID=2957500 RepID=UPI0029A49089|nr:hypothetical protein [Dietzia sp. PP-33]MDX2357249.1 hypothetical protein [Dietzia sp. PP-33]